MECDISASEAAGDQAGKDAKPGMVARLLELKKRRQHIANGTYRGQY
jgi:hypothetical protein